MWMVAVVVVGDIDLGRCPMLISDRRALYEGSSPCDCRCCVSAWRCLLVDLAGQAIPSSPSSSSDNEKKLLSELETVRGKLKDAVQANVDLHRLVCVCVCTQLLLIAVQ
jgi:hypothetical protein